MTAEEKKSGANRFRPLCTPSPLSQMLLYYPATFFLLPQTAQIFVGLPIGLLANLLLLQAASLGQNLRGVKSLAAKYLAVAVKCKFNLIVGCF